MIHVNPSLAITRRVLSRLVEIGVDISAQVLCWSDGDRHQGYFIVTVNDDLVPAAACFAGERAGVVVYAGLKTDFNATTHMSISSVRVMHFTTIDQAAHFLASHLRGALKPCSKRMRKLEKEAVDVG